MPSLLSIDAGWRGHARSRPTFWAAPVDCLVGAPGEHIAVNAVAALAAVALVDGDVLNAAAALKNFTALKGRGARFEAARRPGDRRKLQRQSGFHGGGAGAAGPGAQGPQHRGAGRHAGDGRGRRRRIMPAWPSPSKPRDVDLVFACGRADESAVGCACRQRAAAPMPRIPRRWRPSCSAALEARRHGAGERFARQPDGGDRRRAESEGG